jgi:hypothetical protein
MQSFELCLVAAGCQLEKPLIGLLVPVSNRLNCACGTSGVAA